ncbi:hypothetical protein L3Q82_012109, partial [Scortum barcoo]
STVGAIIRKWKKHHLIINRPRTGAPRKISDQGVRKMVRRVLKEPRTNPESAPERHGGSRYKCYRENDRQCTPPPWPLWTLSPQDPQFLKKRHVPTSGGKTETRRAEAVMSGDKSWNKMSKMCFGHGACAEQK